jgi:hypothetical protein
VLGLCLMQLAAIVLNLVQKGFFLPHDFPYKVETLSQLVLFDVDVSTVCRYCVEILLYFKGDFLSQSVYHLIHS